MWDIRKHLTNIPLLALIAANALLIFAVLFFGWNAFHIVLLYWAENLIIGFYTIVRMALSQPPTPEELEAAAVDNRSKRSYWATGSAYHASKLFYIPLFIFHYGWFAGGAGIFVFAIFGYGEYAWAAIETDNAWPCFLMGLQWSVMLLKLAFRILPEHIRLLLLALFVSHGISFVWDYLRRPERRRSSLNAVMWQPYGRAVLLQIAIMGGGFVAMAIGSPIGVLALIILVILKTIIDGAFHIHRLRTQQELSDDPAVLDLEQ